MRFLCGLFPKSMGDESHPTQAERGDASGKGEEELGNEAQPVLLNDASRGSGTVRDEPNDGGGGDGAKAGVVIGRGEREKAYNAIPISESTGGVIGGGMGARGGKAHRAPPTRGGPNYDTSGRGLEWGFGHGSMPASEGVRGSGSAAGSSGGLIGRGTEGPHTLSKKKSRWWGGGGGGGSGHSRQGNNGGVGGGHLEIGSDNWAGIDNDVYVSATAIRNLNPRGNLRVGVGSYSGGYNIAHIGDSDASNARGLR